MAARYRRRNSCVYVCIIIAESSLSSRSAGNMEAAAKIKLIPGVIKGSQGKIVQLKQPLSKGTKEKT